MSYSEDEINKRLSKKRAPKERHRINSKLNITVRSQPLPLKDVPSLSYLSNIGPIQLYSASPFDSTSPSTKSIRRLEDNNNNDIGSFIIHCQGIKASPSAGSVLHAVSFGKILQSANVKDIVNGSVKRIGRNCIAFSFLNPTAANTFLCDPLLALKGESCTVREDEVSCFHCLGRHTATSKLCRELDRQNHIKIYMAEEYISYSEASKNICLLSSTVAAVSKTWLRQGSHLRAPSFVCLRNDRSDAYGGAPVLIRNHTPFSLVAIPVRGDRLQTVAVKVEGTTFLSLCIASPSPLILNELESISPPLRAIHKLRHINYKVFDPPPSRPCHRWPLMRPYIMLGDFNCHHTLWGCGGVDSAGRTLVEIMDKLDLLIVKNSTSMRRDRPHSSLSALDLFFADCCSPTPILGSPTGFL
ncbi:hypothetical protein EVAR_82994_1 [Eumeta japonica]|uniref:Endonuclease/exonuclease/phosphatase domain-containing protein n=1 Tax=Eumeta variegata TaxID=151549 RepID=A0A4C1VT93_EUMVA|nr:hypothetical protein EVAR_82994_1 [Eumeta japonica]